MSFKIVTGSELPCAEGEKSDNGFSPGCKS